jgi:hypothetical protein
MRTIQIAMITLVLAASAALVQAQEPKRVQGFSVLLLLGETQGTAQPDNISAPARKALADIKDFLPYKSYRVLDTLWLAGSDFGNSSGRLRGIDDVTDRDRQNYEFELRTFPRVPAAKAGTADAALSRAQFRLLPGLRAGEIRTAVLDNSFNITAGETVVVGTSRLQGEKALIVLLTAVAAGK